MSLFGITAFLFALGVITLALDITNYFQDDNVDAPDSLVMDTASLLMVRLCDAFLSSA